MNYVIIGSGIAAAGAVEGIRNHDKEGPITVIDGENRGCYTRPLITYYLSQNREAEQMYYRPPAFFRNNQVNVIPGPAVKIDQTARQVVLATGNSVNYDRLLLATGASPVKPELPGMEHTWVKTMYTWQDAEQLEQYIIRGDPAVIMGSGLIGIKAAEALHKRGMQVTIIEKESQLLPRLLSPPSAVRVVHHLQNQGIDVLVGQEVTAFYEDHRIELSDGRKIMAQLVIIATGTRPNHFLVRECGLAVGRGVIVDKQLCTSDPHIYAAGDVIETPDVLTGQSEIMALLPLAHREGYLAGQNMAGKKTTYQGGIFINALNILGMSIIASGNPRADGKTWSWQHQDQYLELTVEGDYLRRYICINMPEVTGPLTAIIEQQSPFPETAWRYFINQPCLSNLPREYWEKLRRCESDGSAGCTAI